MATTNMIENVNLNNDLQRRCTMLDELSGLLLEQEELIQVIESCERLAVAWIGYELEEMAIDAMYEASF
jgi:hypothetical protein